MRTTFARLAEAETRARDGDAAPAPITEEEAARPGKGLIDESHFWLFMTWYQMGGLEHPPTLTELAAMPAAMRSDILYLLRELGSIRRSQRKRGEKPNQGPKRKAGRQ